jgi:hypothetical protein
MADTITILANLGGGHTNHVYKSGGGKSSFIASHSAEFVGERQADSLADLVNILEPMHKEQSQFQVWVQSVGLQKPAIAGDRCDRGIGSALPLLFGQKPLRQLT